MPQVMETNVRVATRAVDAGDFQRLVESIAQGGNRIPSSAWAGKERLLGSAGKDLLPASGSAESRAGQRLSRVGELVIVPSRRHRPSPESAASALPVIGS